MAPVQNHLLANGGLYEFLSCLFLLCCHQVESFWLSDTLPVSTAAASSRAGSTCPSASHSRTSSIQGLPGVAAAAAAATGTSSGGQEALLAVALEAPGGAAADDGSRSSAGGGGALLAGGSVSGSSGVEAFAGHNADSMQEGELHLVRLVSVCEAAKVNSDPCTACCWEFAMSDMQQVVQAQPVTDG